MQRLLALSISLGLVALSAFEPAVVAARVLVKSAPSARARNTYSAPTSAMLSAPGSLALGASLSPVTLKAAFTESGLAPQSPSLLLQPAAAPSVTSQQPVKTTNATIAHEARSRAPVATEKTTLPGVRASLSKVASKDPSSPKTEREASGSRTAGWTRWMSYFDGRRARGEKEFSVQAQSPGFRRHPSGLNYASAAQPGENFNVRFTQEFSATVEEMSQRDGDERWRKAHWDRLRNAIQFFIAGQSGRKIERAKRGAARQAGIWKFKWQDEKLRVFFYYDPINETLTLLEVWRKGELLAAGQDAVYDKWAAAADSIDERWVSGRRQQSMSGRLGPIKFKRFAPPWWVVDGDEAAGNAGNINEVGGGSGSSGFRKRFSGLDPPALGPAKNIADYVVPKSLRNARLVRLVGHFGLLFGALAALGTALGALPVALAGMLVIADLFTQDKFVSIDNGGRAFNRVMYGDEARLYQNYLTRTMDALLARAGVVADSSPQLDVTNIRGTYNASVEGTQLDGSAHITFGEGYAQKPAEETAAVMAHEFGHVVNKDFGMLRVLRNHFGMKLGLLGLSKIAVQGAVLALVIAAFGPLITAGVVAGGLALGVSALFKFPKFRRRYFAMRQALMERWESLTQPIGNALGRRVLDFEPLVVAVSVGTVLAHWALQLLGFGFIPEDLALQMTLASAAFPLGFAGLLFGIAVARQDELRADHFGGWLTRPEWMAAHFRERNENTADVRKGAWTWKGFKWRYWATHPTDAERIRALESTD
jgi:Zn-dependent protease with chaperone function